MRWVVLVAVACHARERAPSPPPASPPAPVNAVNDAAISEALDAVSDPTPITFAATGDIMIGAVHPSAALPPSDGAKIFAAVSPALGAADLAFGNLEGPLYDGNEPPHCTTEAIAERHPDGKGKDCWSFRMPERYADRLRDAGFDVVSIANNHIDDFGAPGRASTIAALDQAKIKHSGPTGTVAHLEVRGHAVDVIAFATYDGLNDLDDVDAARALVAASVARKAIAIVSFHGGAEGIAAEHVVDRAETYHGDRRGSVVRFAHAMIDAGASLVVGHGPHVLRGLELRDGKLIAYSLGAFATHRGINVGGALGITAILEVKLATDGRFLGGKLISVRQAPGAAPRLDPDGGAIRAVRRLSGEDFKTPPAIADDGTIGASL